MADKKEVEEEKVHFMRIVQALKNYPLDSKDRIRRTRAFIKDIPVEQQRLLSKHSYQQNLAQLEKYIDLNTEIINAVIEEAETMFENQNENLEELRKVDDKQVRRTLPSDVEKVHSTLKALVRDWSEDCVDERGMSYGKILQRLETIYCDQRREDIKVLVPGAGAGRLAWEIAKLGYECQGNEFSLFMLLASNFVLNKSKSVNCFTIYPWIHQFTNNLSFEDMVRPSSFPDVSPNDLPETANFSMAAGDFLEVYRADEYYGYFDCVVTCFFIDCAHNVVEFIELIHRILKPGGQWINLGPLLYHFADIPRETSIEPTYDVVRNIIDSVGFIFDLEDRSTVATYCQNPRSMLQFHYKCVYFSCTKSSGSRN